MTLYSRSLVFNDRGAVALPVKILPSAAHRTLLIVVEANINQDEFLGL
jgi:hypothetical protein